MRLRRRSRLPREVRDSLALEPGERVLAFAPDAAGRWVVGTDRALHVPGPGPGPAGPDPAVASYDRIAWDRIERAEWDRDAEILRVVQSAPPGERMPLRVLRFERSERLLTLIRERITASVVLAQHVPLRDGLGVRVIARRPPGTDLELEWALDFDEGVDPSDPQILAAAERALAEVRGQVEP